MCRDGSLAVRRGAGPPVLSPLSHGARLPLPAHPTRSSPNPRHAWDRRRVEPGFLLQGFASRARVSRGLLPEFLPGFLIQEGSDFGLRFLATPAKGALYVKAPDRTGAFSAETVRAWLASTRAPKSDQQSTLTENGSSTPLTCPRVVVDGVPRST